MSFSPSSFSFTSCFRFLFSLHINVCVYGQDSHVRRAPHTPYTPMMVTIILYYTHFLPSRICHPFSFPSPPRLYSRYSSPVSTANSGSFTSVYTFFSPLYGYSYILLSLSDLYLVFSPSDPTSVLLSYLHLSN